MEKVVEITYVFSIFYFWSNIVLNLERKKYEIDTLAYFLTRLYMLFVLLNYLIYYL